MAEQDGTRIPRWLIAAVEPRALQVYALVWAEWADYDTGECWPAHDTIAAQLKVSTRTVRRALAELEAVGAIKREKRGPTSDRLWLL